MSAIASQFAAGVDQAMAALGMAATYIRADTKATLGLTVAVASPEYGVFAGDSGMLISADTWEILVRVADLLFDGAAYEPQNGDTIVIVAGGFSITHATLIPDGRRFCWTWADRFRVRRKLFSKITSVEPST